MRIQKISYPGFVFILYILLAACTPTTEPSVPQPAAPDPTAPAEPSEPNAPEGSSVYINQLDIMILESFPVQVSVDVQGELKDGCQQLDGITASRVGNLFTLNIEAHSEGDACTMALVPFTENLFLDVAGLSAGTYQVVANGTTAEFTLDIDNSTPTIETADIVSGQITVRDMADPISLPSGSTLVVRIEDIALQDAPSILLAEMTTSVQELPSLYEIVVDPSVLGQEAMVAVSADVYDNNGELLYLTDTIYDVEMSGGPVNIELIALTPSEPEETDSNMVTTLYVDANLADCVGVAPQKCMLTRTDPNSEWEFFYDQIEGFTHTEGIAYELRVQISEIANPPADGSSLRYELVEVVSETAANPNTSTTLYVDANLADCVGVVPQKCLLTRTDPNGEWEFFYDQIEGFTHTEGIAYELRVQISEIANPPADGSSLRYELVAVVSETAVGTEPISPTSGNEAGAYPSGLEISILESFPVQVEVTVRGDFADGCGRFDALTAERTEQLFQLQLHTHDVGEICTMALVPFEESILLDVAGLKAGIYQVVLGELSAEFTLDADN